MVVSKVEMCIFEDGLGAIRLKMAVGGLRAVSWQQSLNMHHAHGNHSYVAGNARSANNVLTALLKLHQKIAYIAKL